MGWSWYLGCDMIFFVMSPALLLLHHHRPKILWTVMIAVALASSVLTVRSFIPISLSLPADPSYAMITELLDLIL